MYVAIEYVLQNNTVWRETLEGANFGELAGKRHWRNKLWRIDYKSLIKRILK